MDKLRKAIEEASKRLEEVLAQAEEAVEGIEATEEVKVLLQTKKEIEANLEEYTHNRNSVLNQLEIYPFLTHLEGAEKELRRMIYKEARKLKDIEKAIAEASKNELQGKEEEEAAIELFSDEDSITVYQSKYFMLYSKLSYLINTLGLKEDNIKYLYNNSNKLNSIAKFKKAIAIEEALIEEVEKAVAKLKEAEAKLKEAEAKEKALVDELEEALVEEVVKAVEEAVEDVERSYIEVEVKSIVKEALKKEEVEVEAIKEEAIAFIEYMIEERN